MTLTLYTAPTFEPLTEDEVRNHLLQFNGTGESSEINDWIVTARQYCEQVTHRSIPQQTHEAKLDCFSGPIVLQKPPLVSVTSVAYIDTNGVTQTLSSSLYTVVPSSDHSPGYIVPIYGGVWPSTRSVPNAVTVRYVAGYTTAALVPARIKHAMKLLIAHWSINREPQAIGNIVTTVEHGVDALLWPLKVWA